MNGPTPTVAHASSGPEPTPATEAGISHLFASAPPNSPADQEEQDGGLTDTAAPPQSEPLAEVTTASPPVEPAEANPFDRLLNTTAMESEGSVASVEEEPRIFPSTDAQRTETPGPEIGGFNPFAVEPEAPAQETPTEVTLAPEPEKTSAVLPDVERPEPELAIFPTNEDESVASPTNEAGPTLMPSPSFGGLGEPESPTTTTATLPAQQPELPIFEAAADPDTTSVPDTSEIVQAGGERSVDTSDEPDSFLVFPGAQDPDDPATAPSESAGPQEDMAAVLPEEDLGPVGEFPSGDEAGEPVGPRGVVYPDGSIEMTIKPRDEQEPAAFAAETSHQETLPATDPFRPFSSDAAAPSTSDENSFRTGGAVRPLPNRAESPRALTLTPTQPPADESPETVPSGHRPLTPTDYIGVGTVSAETPSTPQQAQLTIQKQAPEDAVLGQDLIYSILVKNIGHSPAHNVVVEDLVPKGSELKGTDPQAQMTPEKKLVWQLGTMRPGAERRIRIKVVPTTAGQIGSVATVAFEAAVASRTIINAPPVAVAD